MKAKFLLLIALAGIVLLGCKRTEIYTDGSETFVKVPDVIPDVILEIRYHSTYNFVGQRIEGYMSPMAYLTWQAADSLKVVSDELKELGYRIKIWDAYRPQRAVDHFIRWAEDLSDTTMKAVFYPMVDKSELFEKQYILSRSGHTRGSTVDLTLVDEQTGKEINMGSPFDWFGDESHPDYCGNPETGEFIPTPGGLTKEQFEHRMLLRSVMLKHGFAPIDSEWWHFTLKNEPYPDKYFNFPVR